MVFVPTTPVIDVIVGAVVSALAAVVVFVRG